VRHLQLSRICSSLSEYQAAPDWPRNCRAAGYPSFSLKCLMENDASLPELIREEERVDGFADAMLDFRP